MKKLLLLAFPIALAACADSTTEPVVAGGPATAPGQNKLQCFSGTTDDSGFGGTCTLNSSGARGQATLVLDGANPAGDYAGVFTFESNVYGALLTDLTQVSYHYTASHSPTPGNLSYNIPIDTDDDGDTEFFLFVDAFYCPGTDGVVNIITDADCGVWAGGTTFYENWSAFVAAHPGARVAATDNFTFIVAERTPAEPAATYTLNNVKFGKPGN